MFVVDDIFTDDEGNTIDVLKLRHPKTGEGAYFVVNKIVHEIIKFSDDKRYVTKNSQVIWLSINVKVYWLFINGNNCFNVKSIENDWMKASHASLLDC